MALFYWYWVDTYSSNFSTSGLLVTSMAVAERSLYDNTDISESLIEFSIYLLSTCRTKDKSSCGTIIGS
jgi:hypothetical protein